MRNGREIKEAAEANARVEIFIMCLIEEIKAPAVTGALNSN
jgi:hypothetical protein